MGCSFKFINRVRGCSFRNFLFFRFEVSTEKKKTAPRLAWTPVRLSKGANHGSNLITIFSFFDSFSFLEFLLYFFLCRVFFFLSFYIVLFSLVFDFHFFFSLFSFSLFPLI